MSLVVDEPNHTTRTMDYTLDCQGP
jgi:hypothetical protein